MSEIELLNEMIKAGKLDINLPENKSTLCYVWGLMAVRYKRVTWREQHSGFLGGGIYNHYWYELVTDSATLKIRDYRTSLRIFLNYVNLH